MPQNFLIGNIDHRNGIDARSVLPQPFLIGAQCQEKDHSPKLPYPAIGFEGYRMDHVSFNGDNRDIIIVAIADEDIFIGSYQGIRACPDGRDAFDQRSTRW